MEDVKKEILGTEIKNAPKTWEAFSNRTFIACIEHNRQKITLLTYVGTQQRGNRTIVLAIRDNKIVWGWVDPNNITRKIDLIPPPKANLNNPTDKLLAEGEKTARQEYNAFVGISQDDVRFLLKDNALTTHPAAIIKSGKGTISNDLSEWLRGAATEDASLTSSKLSIQIEVLPPINKEMAETLQDDFAKRWGGDEILSKIKFPTLDKIVDKEKEDDNRTRTETSVTTETTLME